MKESRADFWLSINIGDHLSQTMNLTPEQHGGYLFLILHQWRNGRFREDEMGTICRFSWFNSNSASSTEEAEIKKRLSRALAPIKQLLAEDENGLWYSPYYERKKNEIVEKYKVTSERARKGGLAKAKKWRENHASSTPEAVLVQCLDSAQTLPALSTSTTLGDSLRSSPLRSELAPQAGAARKAPPGSPEGSPKGMERDGVQSRRGESKRRVQGISPERSKPATNGHVADSRFSLFQAEVLRYWSEQNPAGPSLLWHSSDSKALSDLLQAEPELNLEEFRRRLINRAHSEVNPSMRPRRWLRDLVEFASGPLDRYKQPRSRRSL